MPDDRDRTASETAPEEVIGGLGRIAPDEARALREGPRRLDDRLQAVEENRGWLLATAAAMAVAAVVLPTAGLYELFSAVGQLSQPQLIAAIAAACLIAGVQMAAAVYLWLRWEVRRLCYRTLRAIDRERAADARSDAPPASSRS